jgi:hypothetical protein
VRCNDVKLVAPSLAAAAGARVPLGGGHRVEEGEEPLRHLDVPLIAGLMEGNQDLVGHPVLSDHDSAYWLLDEIALIQPFDERVAVEEFQVWTLTAGALGC